MKRFFLLHLLFPITLFGFSQTIQATLKAGSTPRTLDVYLKSSTSFSQKDEAATITIAIPASVTPAPSMGSSGVTANGTGPVSGITGLQPEFLINNLGSTSREVVVSMQNVNGSSYYIFTFIFSGTATASHDWIGGTEQLIFSIQFNGYTGNCTPSSQLLVSLPNGGNSFFYFQPNT